MDYLQTLLFNLVEQFENFLIEYDIGYTPRKSTINNLKRSTINNNLKEPSINNISEEPTINKDNTDNIPKEQTINNLKESSFIETPEWIKN